MSDIPDSVAFDRYRLLSHHLAYTRWVHDGHESKEEDEIMEEKDVLWEQLTEAQRDEIHKTPPITRIQVDVDKVAHPESPPRKWVDVPQCRDGMKGNSK